MKATRTGQWFRTVALGCAMAAGTTAFGYDDGGRYVAETETFAAPTPLEGDVWIGNDNAGVFTADNRFVWASSNGLDAGATLTGWLRVADWNGTEERPLYGSFEITGGSYSAAGFQVGGDYTEYTHAWATLTDGQLTVGKVNVGSSNENAGEAVLTLAGGSLVVGENGIVGAGTFNLNGGTLTTPSISGVALVVNGGTFANDTDATISVAVTGSGTLTKTGAGALAITGDLSGFNGKIAVAEGAGRVLLGDEADAEEITAGNTKAFGTALRPENAEYVYVGPTTTNYSINNLDNADNFTLNGEETEYVPGEGDTIVFTYSVSLRWGSRGYTLLPAIRIEKGATVSVSGNSSGALTLTGPVTGEGTFSMTGAGNNSGFTFLSSEISCAKLNISGTNYVKPPANGLFISSDLTGNGILYINEGKGSKTNYARFSGNNSEFAGTVTMFNYSTDDYDSHRDWTRVTPSASSAKASWYFYGNNRTGGEYTPLTENGDYYFGALNGYVYLNTTALNTYGIHVGGRNENCEFGGVFSRGSTDSRANPTLYKEGTAKLTVTADKIRHAVIEDGILDIADANAVPYTSLTFKGGTLQVTAKVDEAFVDPSNKFAAANDAPIKFDSNGGEHEWATALSGSKGLVKKGAGTLTLNQEPTFTGAITVEANGGSVVVPLQETYTYTLGENTGVIATDTTAGTRTLAYVQSVVAGGSASYDTEAEAKAASVVLTTEQTEQGLQTSYYTTEVAYNSETGKYDVTAVLDEDAVKPTVAGEGAMEVTTSIVSLDVSDAKVGLYYGIAVGDTANLGLSNVSGELVKCTAAGKLELTAAALPESGVKYYKVVVSDVQK